MPQYRFLLSGNSDPESTRSPVIEGGSQSRAPEEGGGETNTEVAQPSGGNNNAAADGGPFGFLGSFGMIFVWVAVLGVMYFLTIRPQRKRDKQLKELQSSIKPGDNVLTSSGLYGKIMDVGEDCFVVEFGTNRGIRIPVRKSDVLGIQSPKMANTHKET